jgi:plastocyanin
LHFERKKATIPPVALPVRGLAGVLACAFLLVVPAFAQGAENLTPQLADTPDVAHAKYDGVQHLHYKYGPLPIQAGQNNIQIGQNEVPKPKVDGWITRMQPNLELMDGTVPPVDVIHLHHAVWLNVTHPGVASGGNNNFAPFFAAGEEKTIFQLPQGYGMRYRASDKWILNYMIHNLTSRPTKVYITWDIDFVPDSAPGAKGMVEAHPLWMDVRSGEIYPVFDVHRGAGTDGTYTYPDQDPNAYPGGRQRNMFTADRDMLLLGTAGHLHPGGLHDDLWLTRPGAQAAPSAMIAARCTRAKAKAKRAKASSATSRDVKEACARPAADGDTVHLFKSMADYFEPAGAVSWDVAMTGTPADWRVQIHKGDQLRITSTYDTTRSSWYESMGIMVVYYADQSGGPNPFVNKVDWPGKITHGHLPENDNHGGKPAPNKFTDVSKLPSGPVTDKVTIADFTFAPGDIGGIYSQVPVVKAGQTLKFFNNDAPRGVGIWHTITSCKAPCDRSTGVAYPLADGNVQFDSGELGNAGPPTAGRTDWTVPTSLPTGTYTYFCRIHPSMRGAFRVAA